MKTLVLTLCVLTMGHFSSFAVETGPTGPENPLEGGGGGTYTYYCSESGTGHCIEVTSTQSLPSCYASAAQCCAAGGTGSLCGSSNGSNGGTGLNDDSAAFTDDDGATNIITATDTSPSNTSTLLKFRCKNDAPDAEPHIHYLDAPDKPLHFCNQGNRGGFKSWVVQNYEGNAEAVDTLDRDGGDITGPPTDTNGGSTTGTNGGSTTGSSGTGSGDGGSGNTQTFE